MKKSWRVLSWIFCFIFLFFAGCGFGEEDFGDLGDEISTRMLSGVKVLSKPSTYDFKEAVGVKASENYYNIFAHEILDQLYLVYETTDTGFANEIFDFTGDELNNGMTYGHFGDNKNNKYYLYDSLRYTITKVTSVLDESEAVESQIVELDLSDAWNWSVPTNINENTKLLFEKRLDLFTKEDANKYSSRINWLDVTSTLLPGDFPSFSQYYALGEEERKPLERDSSYPDYYYSPAYTEGYSGEALVNYYQDALEYATYLFVLGFDYVDDAGQEIANEKDYFNFIIDKDGSKFFPEVRVKFNNEEMSVSEALKKVKVWYKQMGNIVGLTAKNKQQLKRFILDKVIGKVSPSEFSVQMFTQKQGESATRNPVADDLKFNRNYDAVVENIIDYACEQTRIGYTTEGENLTLDHEYMASTVTDYPGNDFFVNYGGSEQSDDKHLFHFIQPGEYQSFVLMPELIDVKNGLPLSDIHLAFEYYNDDADADADAWASDPTKVYDLNGITINVGLRFFDKSEGKLITFEEEQVFIPYGRYDSFENDVPFGDPNKIQPDEYWLFMSTDKVDSGYSIYLDKEIKFDLDPNIGCFNNNIDGGALNAYAKDNHTITLSGTNKAREFYVTNPSSSYGSFGTLNYEKFLGEDGCDYLEVYFDIVKDKTHPEINYNFKVALTNLYYDDGNHTFG